MVPQESSSWSPAVTVRRVPASGSGVRADGATGDLARVLEPNSWRWSRRLGAWWLPRTSRRKTVDPPLAPGVELLGEIDAAVEVARVGVGRLDRAARERAARLDAQTAEQQLRLPGLEA